MNNDQPKSALGFIRALDLSESIAGQYCCRMLADYGADVLLIEPPAGSVTRQMGPFSESSRQSLLFHHLNLGKGSMALDQATPAGSQLLRDLAATADVIVIPADIDRAVLRSVNSAAIICTVSPFGDDGPRRNWRGTEMIYQAMSGMMIHNGRGDREPLYGAGQRASYCAGVAAYITILSALIHRERTGVAQNVALDIAHAAASMTYPFALQYSYNGSSEPRGDRGQPLVEVRCRDGYMAIWIRPNQFENTCEAIGAPELITDRRFADPVDRRDNFPDFIREVQARVSDRSASELVARLQAKRVVAACCFTPSQLGPDAPHLKVRDFWQRIDADEGPRLALGPQFRMSRTPRLPARAAPRLGQASLRGAGGG